MVTKKTASGGRGAARKLKLKKDTLRDLDARKSSQIKAGMLPQSKKCGSEPIVTCPC